MITINTKNNDKNLMIWLDEDLYSGGRLLFIKYKVYKILEINKKDGLIKVLDENKINHYIGISSNYLYGII